MTKTLTLSAAAAAFLLAGGSAAWAQCDLPNDNWTCQERTVTGTGDPIFTRHGNSNRCEVAAATTTTTFFEAVNPGGQRNPQHDGEPTVVTGDPVRLEGGEGNQPCPDGTP